MKQKLWGINSGVDEIETQINDLKLKEEKKIIRIARRKINPKNEDREKSYGITSNARIFDSQETDLKK